MDNFCYALFWKATMFQVSKPSHTSRMKHYFANAIQETWLEAYRTLLALHLSFSNCSTPHRQTHQHTPYTSLAHAHRGITNPQMVLYALRSKTTVDSRLFSNHHFISILLYYCSYFSQPLITSFISLRVTSSQSLKSRGSVSSSPPASFSCLHQMDACRTKQQIARTLMTLL